MQFDRQIETALRLIKKNGQPVIWRSLKNISSKSEPWKPSGIESVDYSVDICFLPINGRETKEYLGKTEVITGSVIGYMGKVDFEPSAKDVVMRDGSELRIESIDLLSPNGQKILYTVTFK